MQEYDETNPKTHKGYDLRRMPMAALYKEYGLDPMTVDFIGHAIALHRCAAIEGILRKTRRPRMSASSFLAAHA